MSIQAVKTNGAVTSSINNEVEDADIVVAGQNFYCTVADAGEILKVSSDVFTNHVGDVVLTVSGIDDAASFYIVHGDTNTLNFVKTRISCPYISDFEHSTFAPIDIPSVSP